MEWVCVFLVYVGVFGLCFVLFVEPWLDEFLMLCWLGAMKGIVCCSLTYGGLQALGRQFIWPLVVWLRKALSVAWREFYFWTVGDAED